jgi:uncharacterized membrane protein
VIAAGRRFALDAGGQPVAFKPPMDRALVSLFIAGLAFHGSHVLLSSTRLRGQLREQTGERGFLLLYSAVSLVTFAWFVVAYVHAPSVPLWPDPGWARGLAIALMPFAAVFLICGYSTPNPTAVGMERSAAGDDPAPGILRVTRHPIMWGIGLWALVHVPPNGDLASLVFFGSLALLALGGTVLIDRKKRLAFGSNWPRFAQVTSNVPFWALATGRAPLRLGEIGILRIVAGLLLYAVLLLAHPLFTGGHSVW